MKVFILAGGLGTRLRDVVRDVPKPMAPVGEHPFLSYQLRMMKEQGFDEFVLCVGHLYEEIVSYYGGGEDWEDISISYSVEPFPLGTGGALLYAEKWIDETPGESFLLLNGDTYVEADFQAMVAHHEALRTEDKRVIGTILTSWTKDTYGSGVVEMDPCGRVMGFREKEIARVGSGWVSSGAYVLEREVLSYINPSSMPVSLEREVLPRIVQSKHRLDSFPAPDGFIDIGTPRGYRRFCDMMERERMRDLFL